MIYQDYCDKEITFALLKTTFPILPISIQNKPGVPIYYELPKDHPDWCNCKAYYAPTLYSVQQWLMTMGIFISPRIYLYRDSNFDDKPSWECTIYVEWNSIKVIGKSLSYQDALKLGIKEGLKYLKA